MKKLFLLMFTVVLCGMFCGCSDDDKDDNQSSELVGTWRYGFSSGYVLMYFGNDGMGWHHEYDEDDGGWEDDREDFSYTFDASTLDLRIRYVEDGYVEYVSIVSLEGDRMEIEDFMDEYEVWKRVSNGEYHP